MTAASVTAEIARLDALSRTRALDDRESRQLQKLVSVERRYRHRPRAREAIERSGRLYTVAARDDIVTRIEATLAKIPAGQVRAIYLTAIDMAALQATGLIENGPVNFRRKPAEGLTYRGHAVRSCSGNTSIIYDRTGVAVTICQRVCSRP